MSERLFVVITTVQRPTPAMERLCDVLRTLRVPLVVVGDHKGPEAFDLPGSDFAPLNVQVGGPFRLGRSAPTGHYARKNIGYLMAIAGGATCIYETDDDNAPLADWAPRSRQVEAVPFRGGRWVNAYGAFTKELIWPRGYPLDYVRRPPGTRRPPAVGVVASIQQGLADGAPDVDAVWRLILDRHIEFKKAPSVLIDRGSFCPFNSQSTWWWPPAYPLLYLPSRCSFRMTDIWRSFVAQRCLWEIDEVLVFHGPEVVQERNPHRLLEDFREEVPGYLSNPEIADQLLSTPLDSNPQQVGSNLLRCYEALAEAGHVLRDELRLVRDWLDDLKAAKNMAAALVPEGGEDGETPA